MLFFSLVILLPVNGKYTNKWGYPFDPPEGEGDSDDGNSTLIVRGMANETTKPSIPINKGKLDHQSYLWLYVVFVYFFTILALYLLVVETKKIIRIRQSYLGTQATVTDRTLRLSGIPVDMRSEDKIKDFIENLDIGKVDSIMLCRNWKRLDKLLTQRMACLRRLEEVWTQYLGHDRPRRNNLSLPVVQPPPPPVSRAAASDPENTQLLSPEEMQQANSGAEGVRPTKRIWYGPLNMYHHKVDAIDYYEEKLRRLDELITEARKKEYTPTPLAFVTMESVAACQMAVQAILDPRPGQLLATLAPPPADVIWANTYLSRYHRMFRSWSIMVFIGLLTIFWAVLLVPLAVSINPATLGKIFPGLESFLEQHKVIQSLLTTGMPTAVVSLLGIAAPYLYACKCFLPGPLIIWLTQIKILPPFKG